MPEDKIRVSARIPKDIYDTCLQRYDNITNAINAGLELLCNQSEDNCQTSEDTCYTGEDNRQINEDNSSRGHIQELRARIEEAQRQIKDMEESLRKAPDLGEFARLQARSEELEKAERDKEYLKGQIAIKDQQLDKQAFSLQSVIQENSRLNVKLLPENTEVKKKWWKFW